MTLPPTVPLTKDDYEALAAFRRALRRFLHVTEEGARAAGLTPQQHQLILAVKGQPSRDWALVGELAEALQIRPHAAGELIDRTAKAGLVERTPDPEDRRSVRISLTAAGEDVLARLSHRNRGELRALQQALRLPFLQNEP